MTHNRITILDGDEEIETVGRILSLTYLDDTVFGVSIDYPDLPMKRLVNNPGWTVGWEIVATGNETRSGTVIGAQQTTSGLLVKVDEDHE